MRAVAPTTHGTLSLLPSLLTAIIATHDPMLIDLADRAIELRDGRIVDGRGVVVEPTGPAGSARLCMKPMQAG
jgi:ABC-type lipoprotein export system ATPase subunit